MQWISVKERLPQQKQHILFMNNINQIFIGTFEDHFFYARFDSGGGRDWSTIKYWVGVKDIPWPTKRGNDELD